MRLRHHSGRIVHVSHGTGPRPTRTLSDVVSHLDSYAADRIARHADTLGVSLWLPPTLAAALAIDARSRARLRAEIDARGLEVVTLSGEPYALDEAVQPDWSDPARLEYTLDLARILVDLLPDDAVRGAVTTVGLGRRGAWDEASEKACSRILGRLSGGLAEVAWHTGRAVRVGFRPAPGAVLDGSASVAAAFARLDKDRLGVCLDLAHVACTWEHPTTYLDRLTGAGVAVIRLEAAAALELADPVAGAETLRRYLADRGPCPVTTPDGGYAGDVTEALRVSPPGPWRVLCRVPSESAPPAPLRATTEVSDAGLRRLLAGAVPGTEHLDIDWVAAVALAAAPLVERVAAP
ncbi:xylose isomerase [Actinoplanes sp. NPDC051859]|uniref:xylose isomerase n=1 Tax=Actinoplanes sp. NPDC051859 TaxID=3363909 RepID=UPI0037A94049